MTVRSALRALWCTIVTGAQYLSIRYTERLAEAGIEPSVGRVGFLRQLEKTYYRQSEESTMVT